ncbi:MAG TPA: ATP-binding protein [Chloroflexia bacterium]|nr:ATP-binding protein [Chloroflexia bacterium]
MAQPPAEDIPAASGTDDTTAHERIAQLEAEVARLRAAEAQLTTILRGVQDGITVQAPDGRIVYANDAAAHFTGYENAEQMLATPAERTAAAFEIVGEEGSPIEVRDLPGRRALAGQPAGELIVGWRRKGETDLRWSVVSARPVYDEAGSVRFVVNFFRDITETRRIQERLHARAIQQAGLADLGQRALAGMDTQGVMQYATEVVTSTLGIEMAKVLELQPDGANLLVRAGVGFHEGVVGHALVSAGPEAHAGYTLARREPVVVDDLRTEKRFPGMPILHEHGVASGMTVVIMGRDGPFGVLGAHSRQPRRFSPDDIHFLSSVANIISMAVERNRAEQEIRQLNTSLQVVVQELEAFSYSVSHDLQAPLRAISGYAGAMQEDYGHTLEPEAQHYLERISVNAGQMRDLINDLLAFARLARRAPDVSHVDMTALARSTFEEMLAAAGNPQVEFTLYPLGNTRGDPAMLRQVFANLLSNALKFSRKKPSPEIEVGCEVKGDENVYYVRDNGAGFDKQYAHKLFSVFQRLHPSEEFEGTGLGLAIVQRIVFRHGGRVWAEGRPGDGATFYFTLPSRPIM